jgi:hypothetical protein
MHTDTQHQTGRSWWSRGWVLGGLLGLLGGWQVCQAADFTCPAGDVLCLIKAINTANANGQMNTIHLEAGTYLLKAVDNNPAPRRLGPNGLPSITSRLIIQGTGAETTIVERDGSAPAFRIVHVAAVGNLTPHRSPKFGVKSEIALSSGYA